MKPLGTGQWSMFGEPRCFRRATERGQFESVSNAAPSFERGQCLGASIFDLSPIFLHQFFALLRNWVTG
jgi:hypothetical protein